MSDVIKYGALIQISKELLEDNPVDFAAIIYDSLFPRTLTPVEIESRRQFDEAYKIESARIRATIEADHDKAMADTSPQMRTVLQLHAPVFAHNSRYASCEGCDPGSNAGDDPKFPCQTYLLAVSL